jgi:hypothetical protein
MFSFQEALGSSPAKEGRGGEGKKKKREAGRRWKVEENTIHIRQ